MKAILVIFNGIRFPYYLIEHAIAQAKEHTASLHALFLKAKEESGEGYGFPSDLDQAVSLTDAEDAGRDDKTIIRHHVKLAADMASTENVSFTSEVLTDSSLQETLKIVNGFGMVFLDAAYDDDSPSMLTNDRFTLKDLVEKASVPVKTISENR